MNVLLGIVGVYFLVILRAKQSTSDRAPYATTFFLTIVMVGYVVVMLFSMESPE